MTYVKAQGTLFSFSYVAGHELRTRKGTESRVQAAASSNHAKIRKLRGIEATLS